MSIITYHYHHALMKQPFGNKHPEDIIQESTTQKNCSDLIQEKLTTKEHKKKIQHISIILMYTSYMHILSCVQKHGEDTTHILAKHACPSKQ